MLNYIDFVVRQEQYKDLLKEAGQERLIKEATGLRRTGTWRLQRRVIVWVGDLMVKWGCKLQHYGTTPSACWPQLAGER